MCVQAATNSRDSPVRLLDNAVIFRLVLTAFDDIRFVMISLILHRHRQILGLSYFSISIKDTGLTVCFLN